MENKKVMPTSGLNEGDINIQIPTDTKPSELTPDKVIENPAVDEGGKVAAPDSGSSFEEFKKTLREIVSDLSRAEIMKAIPAIVDKVTIDNNDTAYQSLESYEGDGDIKAAGLTDGLLKRELDKTKMVNDKYKAIADASKGDTITPYTFDTASGSITVQGGGAQVKSELDKTKAINDRYKGVADANKGVTWTPYKASDAVESALNDLANSLRNFIK